MFHASQDNQYYLLTDPTLLPKASGFLWNQKMMIQVNCRGYATAQFMQPEPAKYSHAPNLEAKTFMQPEQPYYAHHPGRFVYVKDEETGELFSAPYEPMRIMPDQYLFSVGKDKIFWKIQRLGIEIEMCLALTVEDALELWQIKVKNNSGRRRRVSVYPNFTVGYMSWMNQSGKYDAKRQSIVCSSITPYQKYKEYYTIKNFADKTFLAAEQEPVSWEISQEAFEGEGGIFNPSAIHEETLKNGDSHYEMPTCALQYRLDMQDKQETNLRFLFGAVRTEEEIDVHRQRFFNDNSKQDGFEQAMAEYAEYIAEGRGCLEIQTPDAGFDNFVNHWLPRQMYYHGITNRLSTDPQTRNYLQDNMGMAYIKPQVARQAFLHALSQQNKNGSMPDGITLYEGAELKYINQIPHTDHCVWLPVCISTYLDETNDYAILEEKVCFADSDEQVAVFEHITLAVEWLIRDRDERGLNYIRQGDWCDPMNMVGFKGKGVSGWLTIATAYICRVWAEICRTVEKKEMAEQLTAAANEINAVVNQYLWDGEWYARGITDDNVRFGISTDKEGKIFINPQSWSLLSGAADAEKKIKLMKSVKERLETPYGVEKLAPSYTAMREDVGRVTQKYPGTAENGAVYNHASIFYIYALYAIGEKENAFQLLRKMIPGPDEEDIIRRGQLPVFIPNYYRGAYRQIPRTAGRSSHLFNTGTTSWVYRSLVDGLFGLKGTPEGLKIQPQLPKNWTKATAKRFFRGAIVILNFVQSEEAESVEVYHKDRRLDDNVLRNIQPGMEYHVTVKIPR